ncbi:hypothetical protein [Streptomyces sp. NPDC091212]|uniref:hypothetical protein n=1 Tax=Streptomyces sp. NPDC091212 TaxID=3155191 RepID=UPI00343A5F42
MPKGGARARSGPPPDPTALHRERDKGEWVILPAEGRAGATPDWPLTGQSEREAALWTDLWGLPQALMWERNRLQVEVALYVRRLSEVELPGAMVTLGTLVRQMADSLGLTTPGMRSNRWKIERAADRDTSTGTRRSSPSRGPGAAPSARARLRAISGGEDIDMSTAPGGSG